MSLESGSGVWRAMFLADGWKDFSVLDTGDGLKLEKWADVILSRPDPQVIWPVIDRRAWEKADAVYHRSASGGGEWEFRRKLPERWVIAYGQLRFFVHPTGFKHTGLFPEQAANWDVMSRIIRSSEGPKKVLNLFGYTGGATIACAAAGAHVTHVDASKGMIQWAKENRDLNGIPAEKTRFIQEDASSFVKREIRRGSRYDAVILDPPSYGRGPNGEKWKLEDELFGLMELCSRVLSDHPAFVFLNSYTTGLQPTVLRNVMMRTVGRLHGGDVDAQELCLPVEAGGFLPCGATGRWQPL